MTDRMPPQADGLYDPRYEHDACGVAMVARLDNVPGHDVVVKALEALDNLEHRGAEGADIRTGDGAGPAAAAARTRFFRANVDFELPEPRALRRRASASCRATRSTGARSRSCSSSTSASRASACSAGATCRSTRTTSATPPTPRARTSASSSSRPGPGFEHDQDAFERKLYVIRRIVELAIGPEFYSPSCSSRTCVYKGMLKAPQLRSFYPDLQDERFASALALVHSRFSTNTFPSWELAHPYRVICHNGEINTLMGNVNWMRARESQLASELFGIDLQKVLPVVRPGGSDSATFDNVLELLMLAGRSLPHAVMMMIPEAYQDRDDLSDELKGFYAFHSCLMEPWDGPAAVAFTNGRVVGATLDRNGLRPGRWVETKDGYVVLGSETGMLSVRPENVKRLGRLQPGKIFLVDLVEGRIVEDEEVKRAISTPEALQLVVRRARRALQRPRAARRHSSASELPLRQGQLAFGYTQEDLRVLHAPMARAGEEPIGSMGNDAALAVLSDQRPPLFNYFKQLFAQVTNPPIDSTRESIVMSLGTGVGAEGNLLTETPRARPSARDGPADPAQRRARDAALGLHRRLPRAHDRHHVADRRGPGRDAEAPGQRLRRGDRPHRGRASTSSSSPTAPPAPTARRSRRCWPSAPCTTTSCARARACARGSSSSPASRARSTTSPCSSATARARSTPTSCSTRSTSWPATGASPASRTPTRPSGGSSRRWARAC